ncbi:MAG: EamA family transporter, partial [Armatimonadota bacterium]
YVLGGVMLGGLSPVFTKLLLLQNVGGPTIVAARYLLTVMLLIPFGLPHTRPQEDSPPPDRKAWITLFLVGAFGSGLGALLFTAAVDLASAGVVTAISKTAPIFVALFAYFTLRERVTYLRFLLVAVMVAADMLIVAGELTFSGQLISTRLLGDLLALGAGLTRAAAEILGKSALEKFRPTTVALWRFGVGLMVAGTVSVGTGGWTSLLGMGTRGWVILAMLAGVSTALYMALYYRGLSEIPAHVAVSLKLLGAIVTVIVSWIVLGEALTPYHIAGIAVLISGAYLLVMRTAHPRVEEEAPPALPRRPWARLRPRLVGLVILLVVCSVGVVWYLSVRHSAQLLRRQVHLTVGEIAAILVEFGGLEQRRSWQAYEQYLQRVVGHRVQGDLYALEVVYVAALDPRGNIGAYAVAPELKIVDTQGHELRVRDRATMRRLIDEMDRRGAEHDLITATATLEAEGRTVGSLKMGCRRELAEGMVGEIVGRSAVAVLTVLLLAAAIASIVVGGMVEPIERLTAQLWTRRGPHGRGPPRDDIDEVQQIRRALGVVGQAMGLERSAMGGLSAGLARRARQEGPATVEPPPGTAWLAVAFERDSHVPAEALAAVIEATAREAARQDGMLAEVGARSALATWGAEIDDALRAALAARALSETLQGEMSVERCVIAVGAGEDAAAWEDAVRRALKRTDEACTMIIGPGALSDAAEHVECERPSEDAEFATMLGISEPPELESVARDTED